MILNVSNPAAFGTKWVADGATYQLVNACGASSLRMGIRPAGKTSWLNTEVVNPERFGFTGPVKNWKELKAITEQFIAAADE